MAILSVGLPCHPWAWYFSGAHGLKTKQKSSTDYKDFHRLSASVRKESVSICVIRGSTRSSTYPTRHRSWTALSFGNIPVRPVQPLLAIQHSANDACGPIAGLVRAAMHLE
jgi:hypothetical protein